MKKKNKKYLILSLIELLLLASATQAIAQSGIFILDEDEFNQSNRLPTDGGGSIWIMPDMPNHDDPLDYTPVGGGLWILTSLGMCYLCGQRKNKKNENN